MTPETMILPDGSEEVTAHFYVVPATGAAYVACMPGLKDFAAGSFRKGPITRTNEVRAVNCPLCKKTEVFKQASKYDMKMRMEAT